jgi:hypothetical protein
MSRLITSVPLWLVCEARRRACWLRVRKRRGSRGNSQRRHAKSSLAPPVREIVPAVTRPCPAFRAFAAVAALLLSASACSTRSRDAAGRQRDAQIAEAATAAPTGQQMAPIPISLACARASASLPGDSVVLDTAQTRACVDPGYGEDLAASAVAGAQSFHVIRHDACELKLAAGERMPAPREHGELRALSIASEGRVELATPEGSLFEVRVTPVTMNCSHAVEEISAALARSLRVAPLRAAGSHVRATLSSAGHGFELDVPAGFYVVASGGMADQYETSYQLRGPDGAWVTLYTSWRRDPASNGGPFVSTLLGPRTRWRAKTTDLGTNAEGCRGTLGAGPDKRVKVEIIMCGPRAGQVELTRLLATIRLTPPAASATDAPP